MIMELTPDMIRQYKNPSAELAGKIRYMEKRLKVILDRNYDFLYDYFCNALDCEVKYKIFRARRCQVLFQLFLPIILLNEQNIQIRGIFISDHAIAKYKADILKTPAVILDDVVIHGRGLQELYEELDPKYAYTNILIYVHKVARTADAMSEKLKKRLQCDSEVFDWEWRELSTQLVNAIHATVTPYVSFVEAYISAQKFDREKLKDAFIIYGNTNDDQERMGTEAYVIFERDALPRIIQNGGYDACVRYYENERLVKTVSVPYVFMKSLSGNDMSAFCAEFAARLGDKHDALREELSVKTDDNLKLQYKAFLINALMNRFYGLYLDDKYPGLFDFSKADWFTLAMCFGNAVAEDMESLTFSDVSGMMELEFCRTQCDTECEEDSRQLVEGLERAIEAEGDENEVLPLYFYFNRQLDEESVRKKEKREKGLPIETFYNKLGGDKHTTSRLQLRSWDAGTAACDLFVINCSSVALYARAGEQSFRYIVKKLEGLRDGDSSVSEGDGENGQNGEQKLDQELLNRFLADNRKSLCEWRVPTILLNDKG